jgi:hypothetical protein
MRTGRPAVDRPRLKIPAEAVGVAVLTLHNVAVHRALPEPADAALNLATAAGLTAFARHAGCSRADLGIGAEEVGSGLRMGFGRPRHCPAGRLTPCASGTSPPARFS